MANEMKETWLNYLALSTVILAVCATLSTFKGGQYSTRAVMSQSQASNHWAYYQAKSIKAYVYEGQKEKLDLDLDSLGAQFSPERRADYDKRAQGYGQRIQRYEKEKAEISQKARELEQVRDQSQRHSQAFGVAVIFLQIAILLNSIAALMKRKPVWLLGMGIGQAGLASFVNGFFLIL